VDKNKLLNYSATSNVGKSHIEKQIQIIEKNKNEKALQKLKSLGGWLGKRQLQIADCLRSRLLDFIQSKY